MEYCELDSVLPKYNEVRIVVNNKEYLQGIASAICSYITFCQENVTTPSDERRRKKIPEEIEQYYI